MNRTLALITLAILISGCSATDYARITEEQHQAAKTRYYENLNQGRLNALDEDNVEAERAPVEL